MSTTLDKQALVRAAWCTELRRQGHRKCCGWLYGQGNKVCALGLLGEVGGATIDDNLYTIGALGGLNIDQAGHVWRMNDGWGDLIQQHTFSEIADVVESWFS